MKKILYLGLLIAAIGGTTSLAVADIRKDDCSYIGQDCTCSNTGWSGKCTGSVYATAQNGDELYYYYCQCEPPCAGQKCTCHDWENEGVYYAHGMECKCNCSEMEECARIASQPESSEQCNALKAKQCQRFPSIVTPPPEELKSIKKTWPKSCRFE